MFTLTNASNETKIIIKWTLIIIGLIIASFIIFKLGMAIKNSLYPTPPPAPEVRFGKIPTPSFGTSDKNTNFEYSLNTVSGFLPILINLVNVYKFTEPKPDLIGLQKTQNIAASGGFVSASLKISDNVYEWNTADRSSLIKNIKINIINHNFELRSNFFADPDVIAADNLPDEQNAIKTATSFLDQLGYGTDALDLDSTTTKLLAIQDQKLESATSLSNTQIIQVTFYPKLIDNLKTYSLNPNETSTSFLVSGGQDLGQVVYGDYKVRQLGEKASYPVKSLTIAIDELKKGKAYVASYDGTSNKITITDVYIAYFDSGQEDQMYLQPVIVFKGNDNFYAYVNAITDEWVSK